MPMGKIYVASKATKGRLAIKSPIVRRKKKRYVRGRKGILASKLPVNLGFGIPNSCRIKLKYHEVILKATFTGTSGAQAFYQFRPNNVFDPNYTGTGHQPMYRDQIATLYKYYRPYACKYRIIISTDTTSGASGISGTVRPTYDTATPGDYDEECEQPYSRRYQINPYKPAVIRGYIDYADLLGVPKSRYMMDDIFASSVGSAPTQSIILNITGQASDAATTWAANVDVSLVIYIVYNTRATQTSS